MMLDVWPSICNVAGCSKVPSSNLTVCVHAADTAGGGQRRRQDLLANKVHQGRSMLAPHSVGGPHSSTHSSSLRASPPD